MIADEPKILVFYLSEFEQTFGKPEWKSLKPFTIYPFYIYDQSLKAIFCSN